MSNYVDEMYGVTSPPPAQTPPKDEKTEAQQLADQLPGPIEVYPGVMFDPQKAADLPEEDYFFGLFSGPSSEAYSIATPEKVEASRQAFEDARNIRMSEKATEFDVGFNVDGTEVSELINQKTQSGAVSGQSLFYLADTDEQAENALEQMFGEGNVRIIQDEGPFYSMFDAGRYVSVRREDGTFTDFMPTTVTFADYAERVAPGLLAEAGASSAVVGTAIGAGAAAGMIPGAGIVLGPAAFLYTLYAGGKSVEMGRQYLQDEFGLNDEEVVEVENFFDFVKQTAPGTGIGGTEAEVNREIAGALETLFAAVPAFGDRVKMVIGRARAKGQLKPGVYETAKTAQATAEATLPGGTMDVGVPLQPLMLQQVTPNRIIGRLASLSEQTSLKIPQATRDQMQSAVAYLQKYGDDLGEGDFAAYQNAVAQIGNQLRSVIETADPAVLKNMSEIGENLGSLEDLFLSLRRMESRGMYNNVFDRLSNASYDLSAIRTTMPGKKTVLPTTDAAAQKGEKVAGALPTQERGEGILDNLTTDLLSVGRVQKDGTRIITPAQVKAAVRDFAENNPEYTFDVADIDTPAKLLQLYASRYGQLARDQFGEFGATPNAKMFSQAIRMRNDLLELIGNPREEIADIATIRSDLTAANNFYKETDDLVSQRLQVEARQGRRSDVKTEPAILPETLTTPPGGGQRVAPATRTLDNIATQEQYVRTFLSNPDNVARLSGKNLETATGPAVDALQQLRTNFADVFAHKLSRAIPVDPADVTDVSEVIKFLDSFEPEHLRLLGIDEDMVTMIRNDSTLIANLRKPGGVVDQTLQLPAGQTRMADIFETMLGGDSGQIATSFNDLMSPIRRAGFDSAKGQQLKGELRRGLLNHIFSIDKGIFTKLDSNSAFGEVGDLTINVAKFQTMIQQIKRGGMTGARGILTDTDVQMLDALAEYAGVINAKGSDAGSALAGAQIIGEMFTLDPMKFISGLARLSSQSRIASLFANDQFVKAVTGTGRPMTTGEKLSTMFMGKGAFGSIIADVAMEMSGVRETETEQTDRMLGSSYTDDMYNSIP